MSKEYPNEDVSMPKHGGNAVRVSTYYSMAEYANRAKSRATNPATGEYWDYDLKYTGNWAGGEQLDVLVDRCQGRGWDEYLAETLEIAEEAVSMAEREHEMQSFEPLYDVAGDEPDIGRFLTGEPECMIDYPLTIISKVGKVVTLVGSISASCAIEPEDLRRKGQVVAALAIALERLGHSCELWLDAGYTSGKKEYHTRVLIKGANDQVDPAMIILAYAHPGMLRVLGFADCDGDEWSRDWMARGMPTPAYKPGMPEGTIFTPQILSGYARHDVHLELRKYLADLGLLVEGS
jgi:hypothetical protein